MGNAESSGSQQPGKEGEDERKGGGLTLGEVGKAAAVGAALAFGAYKLHSSLASEPMQEHAEKRWLKINTDFSAKRGIGYIIRRSDGNVVFAEAKMIGEDIDDSGHGEAEAVYQALLKVQSLEPLLILECDNEPLVKLLNKEARASSSMKAVVDRILRVMEPFRPRIEVRHAKRTTNRVANHLAREAREGRPWRSDSGEPMSRDLKMVLNEDRQAASLASNPQELKINTDFSAKRGIGYIIRGSNGDVVFAEAKRIEEDIDDSGHGEAEAVYQALLKVHSLGVRPLLILDCDNGPLVKLLNKEARASLSMKAAVDRILRVMEPFGPRIQVHHAMRTTNRVANHLAREAREGRPWRSDSGKPMSRNLMLLLNQDQ